MDHSKYGEWVSDSMFGMEAWTTAKNWHKGFRLNVGWHGWVVDHSKTQWVQVQWCVMKDMDHSKMAMGSALNGLAWKLIHSKIAIGIQVSNGWAWKGWYHPAQPSMVMPTLG